MQPLRMPIRRVLTGITTAGSPHCGNTPARSVRRSPRAGRAGVERAFFSSRLPRPEQDRRPRPGAAPTLETAATWLAAGPTPDSVWSTASQTFPKRSSSTGCCLR